MYDFDLVKYGNNVRHFRILRGLTLEQLANLAGYNTPSARSAIQKIESGKCDIPLSKAIKISNALNVPLDYLLRRTDNPEINK